MQWCVYCEKLVQPSRTYNWEWLALIIVSFVAVPIVIVLFVVLPPLGGFLYLILCLFFIFGLIGLVCSLVKYVFFPAVVCPICRTADIMKERPPERESGREANEEDESSQPVEDHEKQTNMEETNVIHGECPHCHTALEKISQRKSRCTFCGHDIYVRTKQKLFASTLLRKDEATVVDWLDRLQGLGFNVKNKAFIKVRKRLSKHLDKEANPKEVLWKYFNNLVAKTKPLPSLERLYYNMALFLSEEGQEPHDILEESRRVSLLHLQQSEAVKHVIITTASDGCCGQCVKLQGKVFTIKEALETMPLPQRNCVHDLHGNGKGFCRCNYAAYVV